MKYISTRGGMAPLEFSDTILMGLAPDGGLALPESYPQVGRAQLDAWRDLSYAELAFEIIRLFATDIRKPTSKPSWTAPTPPRCTAARPSPR